MILLALEFRACTRSPDVSLMASPEGHLLSHCPFHFEILFEILLGPVPTMPHMQVSPSNPPLSQERQR